MDTAATHLNGSRIISFVATTFCKYCPDPCFRPVSYYKDAINDFPNVISETYMNFQKLAYVRMRHTIDVIGTNILIPTFLCRDTTIL